MAVKSIAQRWFINSFAVVLGILVAIVTASGVLIHNFYYSAVRQALRARASTVSSMMLRYSSGGVTSNFYSDMRSYIESFPDKDYMELMAVDPYGNVSVTSSGFSYTNKWDRMPDYDEALTSPDGIGYYVGKLSNGQHIMAVTQTVSIINSEYSAMRFVVSLETVDRMILNLLLIIIGIALAVLALVLVSGLLFVRSIIRPVREIGSAARQIAQGDLKSRIVKVSDDELGELCETINFMADELENSERLKNEFISSVSHELRTPLTAIKGWAETLMTIADDPATLQKGMRVITAETERLSDMVEELLDFSRIQNGRLRMVFQKMDILAELGEAVLTYAERARQENIDMIYNEPEMLPFIYGDKNRLRQVFINVIDNAIKYSDPGGSVKIDAFLRGEDIVITVADSGIGIDPEDLPRIKTKFYKANYSRRGSGIGLAVADEIIQMHHGRIDIESTPGVGTTVIISLPVQEPPEEGTEAAKV
ncbi:MAG: HAMP domain-containing sensor histidine kinase [Oscillospiraceae bacterium]|nr:HAMP domain-containing sensor histidine kinase [Oscillospiraceae bacterium]